MKKLIRLFVLVLGMLPSLSWSVPVDLASLSSRAARITENSRQVAGGTVYISADGMVYSTNVTPYADISTNSVDPEAVLKELANHLLTFEVAHPSNANVWAVFVLRDRAYHTLFSGQKWSRLVQRLDGSWMAAEDAGEVEVNNLYYYQYVWVGEDVYWAELTIYDQDGNIIGNEACPVEDGWMRFRNDRYGVGDVTLHQNNEQHVYDLRNGGQKIVPTTVGLHVVGSMSSLITNVSETVGSYVLRPVSQNGYGSAKVVRIQVTANRAIYFAGITSEGEPAVTVTAVQMETGAKSVVPVTNGGWARIEFAPGPYNVYMGWRDRFDEPKLEENDRGW